MKLRSFGITDVGLKRSHNEDSFYRSDELGLYVVADGMGGHAAGEVASSTAVSAISEFCESHAKDPNQTWPFDFDDRYSAEANALLTGIMLGNNKLCQLQHDRSELAGMGTTIASLRIDETGATFAHVGDSRIYRFRDGSLDLLTNDHSWVNEQLQKNIITIEEARTHRYKNVITRALGNKPALEIDVRFEKTQLEDSFLLCSDGLSGMVDDEVVEQILLNCEDLRECANKLVAVANEAGGSDNITVIIVKVLAD